MSHQINILEWWNALCSWKWRSSFCPTTTNAAIDISFVVSSDLLVNTNYYYTNGQNVYRVFIIVYCDISDCRGVSCVCICRPIDALFHTSPGSICSIFWADTWRTLEFKYLLTECHS